MCAVSAGVAVAQAGIGYLGAQQQAQNANLPIRRANKARRQAYYRTIEQQNTEWNNTLKIWNQRLDQYDKQLKRNMDAAYGYGGAYMGLQVRTNEDFRQAAFQSQASLTKLYQTLGTSAAAGQTGRTAERFDVASLAAFGREQAIRTSNLTRSIEQQELDQTNVRRQLENANNQAYQSVAVAPVPGRRPAPPVMQSLQGSPNALPFIAQGLQGAFSGLSNAGVFGQGAQDAGLGINTSSGVYQGSKSTYGRGFDFNTSQFMLGGS